MSTYQHSGIDNNCLLPWGPIRNYYVHRQVNRQVKAQTYLLFSGDTYQSKPDFKFSNI